ncbi:MAG: hypothetical protein CBC35_00745, partial [Planctomycetes bacterium TMED75]
QQQDQQQQDQQQQDQPQEDQPQEDQPQEDQKQEDQKQADQQDPKTAQENTKDQKDPTAEGTGSPSEQPVRMSQEQAEALLQMIRDREKQRREVLAEREAREAARRYRPVEKDW